MGNDGEAKCDDNVLAHKAINDFDDTSVDPNFVQALLNKNWEVYWNDEDDNEPADWYEATIEKYNSKTGLFTVHFEGDNHNTIYEMEISKSEVRPSNKAWMNRR